MHLDLARLIGDAHHVAREYPATAFTADEDYCVIGPVKLDIDLTRSEDRCRLAGRVTAPLELSCSRCAEPFAWPVDAAFDLSYLPQTAKAGEGEQEVQEEDLGIAFYDGQVIDLGQLMREQFYLSMPMKPLCSEQCKGLCPQCGTNLNQSGCGCQPRWEDPRLAPLKRLLDEPPAGPSSGGGHTS
jgi:uncharacterized protein